MPRYRFTFFVCCWRFTATKFQIVGLFFSSFYDPILCFWTPSSLQGNKSSKFCAKNFLNGKVFTFINLSAKQKWTVSKMSLLLFQTDLGQTQLWKDFHSPPKKFLWWKITKWAFFFILLPNCKVAKFLFVYCNFYYLGLKTFPTVSVKSNKWLPEHFINLIILCLIWP